MINLSAPLYDSLLHPLAKVLRSSIGDQSVCIWARQRGEAIIIKKVENYINIIVCLSINSISP